MAGSFWSSMHFKAIAEVNAALRARELKNPGVRGEGSAVSQINSSSWCVVDAPACMPQACLTVLVVIFFSSPFTLAFQHIRGRSPRGPSLS